jgi:hypothetical protein
MFATIYHPRLEPNQEWLRTLLLFYDKVHSIAPQKRYIPSDGIARLLDKAEDMFKPLQPDNQDRDLLFWDGNEDWLLIMR